MQELRGRLSDISWFMKLLSEHIARKANREDQVSGKFWESRFKAVPLLDEEALLACSLYVDLNPIRAGKAETPETSEHTSAYQRIQALQQWEQRRVESASACPPPTCRIDEQAAVEADLWLAPISLTDTPVSPAAVQSHPFPTRRASNRGFLPLTLADYLQLLDWTGRQWRSDKRGLIPAALLPIFQRLQVDASRWATLVADFPRLFRSAAGRVESLMKEAERTGRRWLRGVREVAQAFG
jgi:hypothetical protein